MNSIADVDDYDTFNFHYTNRFDQSRPLQLTTPSITYRLALNEKGCKQFVNDKLTGKPRASPRSLLMLCVNTIINDDWLFQKLNDEKSVSSNIFNLIFRESIMFGHYSLIAHLISIWPSSSIKLTELISSEIVNYDSLSRPLSSCGPTILDYVLLGLLISKPSSRLKMIDLTGFHHDLKLTREIVHLSLLWLRPENRTVENIYENIKSRCVFDKSSLTRYLDNFNEMYQEYDRLIQHEVDFGEKSIVMDCHINSEDVTLGLALQHVTPFRFYSKKVWCTYGLIDSEYSLKNYDLLSLINPNHLTHLILKDLFMNDTRRDLFNICSVLERLPNLIGLSLIGVLKFYPSNYTTEETNEVCLRINKILRRSFKLKKIDLSYNHLCFKLFSLLHGMSQPIEYLNLQDCCLESTDIAFLNTSAMQKCLRACKELNLSMNNFSQSHSTLFSIIRNCVQLNCLSISNCRIPFDLICHTLVDDVILGYESDASTTTTTTSLLHSSAPRLSNLKVVLIQPYTPPKMHEIIDIIHSFSRVKSLQRLYFLPLLYAFAGSNDYEREISAIKIIRTCYNIFESQGRTDIEFICQ